MAKQNPSDDKAQTKDKWRSFHPGEYSLNSEVIFKMPISEVSERSDGDTLSTTVGEAFKFFNGWLRKEGKEYVEVKGEPIHEILYPGVGGFTIETPSGKKRFCGTSFAEHLLYVLLNLRKEGINPYAARWFFYDKDSCLEDPTESFAFFLVCDGKIVQERVNFFRDTSDSDFDPAILSDPLEGSEPIWFNEDDWREADTCYWYRKFYIETKTGQLMVLRPDEPELFHYPKPPALADALPHVNWWWSDAILISGAACIYFWSGSVWAGVAGLIFLGLAWREPAYLLGHLLYEMRISTYALQRGPLETRSGNFKV